MIAAVQCVALSATSVIRLMMRPGARAVVVDLGVGELGLEGAQATRARLDVALDALQLLGPPLALGARAAVGAPGVVPPGGHRCRGRGAGGAGPRLRARLGGAGWPGLLPRSLFRFTGGGGSLI